MFFSKYLSNGRDGTTSGTITKTTASGNGATGAITYIVGTATPKWDAGQLARPLRPIPIASSRARAAARLAGMRGGPGSVGLHAMADARCAWTTRGHGGGWVGLGTPWRRVGLGSPTPAQPEVPWREEGVCGFLRAEGARAARRIHRGVRIGAQLRFRLQLCGVGSCVRGSPRDDRRSDNGGPAAWRVARQGWTGRAQLDAARRRVGRYSYEGSGEAEREDGNRLANGTGRRFCRAMMAEP
jgi:hypothetical protein